MMQAIVETLFDAVYLVSVITIGVLMVRGDVYKRQALRLTAVFRANGDRGCRHKAELYLYKRRGLTIKNMCVKLLRHIKKKGDPDVYKRQGLALRGN